MCQNLFLKKFDKPYISDEPKAKSRWDPFSGMNPTIHPHGFIHWASSSWQLRHRGTKNVILVRNSCSFKEHLIVTKTWKKTTRACDHAGSLISWKEWEFNQANLPSGHKVDFSRMTIRSGWVWSCWDTLGLFYWASDKSGENMKRSKSAQDHAIKFFLFLIFFSYCAILDLRPLKSDIFRKSCHRSWDPSCRSWSVPGSDAACSPAERCTNHNMSEIRFSVLWAFMSPYELLLSGPYAQWVTLGYNAEEEGGFTWRRICVCVAAQWLG